jgi:hypothetical protein
MGQGYFPLGCKIKNGDYPILSVFGVDSPIQTKKDGNHDRLPSFL